MLPLLDLETVRQRIPIVYKGRIAADDPGLAADTWLDTAEWADVNLFLDPLPLGGPWRHTNPPFMLVRGLSRADKWRRAIGNL